MGEMVVYDGGGCGAAGRERVVGGAGLPLTEPPGLLELPGPRLGAGERLRIREAAAGHAGDLAFIDALQRPVTRAVGWMPTAQLEGHIAKGHVLIAELVRSDECGVMNGGDGDAGGLEGAGREGSTIHHSALNTHHSAKPVGYLIGVDRYFKRDDVGIVYQVNVSPEARRGLIGAALVRAQFERSAYGCRLYCCWCAQDLAANRFWEAMGFVPIAFRTGGRGRGGRGGRGGKMWDEAGNFLGRMHIFWQKRIRPRKFDASTGVWVEDQHPWWFPSMTCGGAIGEDRVVLPIPPGVHWSDAKPVVLPAELRALPAGGAEGEGVREAGASSVEALQQEAKAAGRAAREAKRLAEAKAGARGSGRGHALGAGGLRFGEPAEVVAEREAAAAKERVAEAKKRAKREAKEAARRVARKHDPKLEAWARELKDRWLEEVAARPGLIEGAVAGKYDVRRALEAEARVDESGGGEGVRVEASEPKRLAA